MVLDIVYHTPKDESIAGQGGSELTQTSESLPTLSSHELQKPVFDQSRCNFTEAPSLQDLLRALQTTVIETSGQTYREEQGTASNGDEDEKGNTQEAKRQHDANHLIYIASNYDKYVQPLSPFRIDKKGKPKKWTLQEEDKIGYWPKMEYRWKQRVLTFCQEGEAGPELFDAMSKWARSLRKQEKYKAASSLCRRVAVLSTKYYGKIHRETIKALYSAAHCYMILGRISIAETIYVRYLEDFAKDLREDDLLLLDIMDLAAWILCTKGRFDKAEHCARQLIRIILTNDSLTHDSLLWALRNLSITLFEKGSYSESIEVEHTVIGLEHLAMFRQSMVDLVLTQIDLAVVYSRQKDFHQSRLILQNCLHRSEDFLGSGHELILSLCGSLAQALHCDGRFAEAIEVAEAAFERSKKSLSSNHPTVLGMLWKLGDVHYGSGDYEEALNFFYQALRGYETNGEELGERDVADLYNKLAWVHKKLGNLEESEKWFVKEREANQEKLCIQRSS